MFSLALRRSAMMVATRGPSTFPKATAAFSTQAMTQVQVVEDMLHNLHWADVRDEVKEIRHILNEPKTNQAIHVPDDTAAFEQMVYNNMTSIQSLLAGNHASHDEIYAKAHHLKAEVKTAMYQFAFKRAFNIENATDQELEVAFNRLDIDNSGSICKKDLRTFFNGMRQEDFDNMFAIIDIDRSETMELNEFKAFVNML